MSGEHLRGLVLCATGVVVISPDALIVRSVDSDAWTTVAWRGIFTAVGTVALLLLLRPGVALRARRLTGPHLFAGALFAAARLFDLHAKEVGLCVMPVER